MVSYYPLGCLLTTVFLLITYFPTNYAQLVNSTQPEVTIPQGTLLGTTLTTLHGRNISSFLGIPYGQPPIGNRRFSNPVPAEGWNGTRNASAYGNWCPQYISNVPVGDEDCLYLNVFIPQLPERTNSSLLPVMVFIHGGSFQFGYSDQAGPQYLGDADVVLVTINYRLGPLGFLSTGDEVASGNWGLKDQVLALQWVQNNIRYFGGDPDQVTLFGESAGAVSVHLLTLSNSTIGLFHKYITQSGSALAPWAYAPRAAYSRLAFELGEYVGCSNNTSESLIICLGTIDAPELIGTFPQFVVWGSLPSVVWIPTDEPDIEGAFLTDSPSNLFAAGQIRDLPWISGIVRDEGLFHAAEFYAFEERFLEFLENFDTLVPLMAVWTYQSDSGAAWTEAVKSYFFNDDLSTNASLLLPNLTFVDGDAWFIYPARRALQLHHALATTPQYFYSLDYRGTFSYTFLSTKNTVNYGPTHGDDLIYLFLISSEFLVTDETMSETDYEIVDTMVQLWTSFAINGTPTASALESAGITWEPYSSADAYLRIGNESDVALEVQYSFFQERMQFWDRLTDAVDSGTPTLSANLVLSLLVACSIFALSSATVARSE